jgi:hypothetical protein
MASLSCTADPARAYSPTRLARLLVVGIVVGWSISNIAFHVAAWSLSDMDAYWNAALRLREGQPLYPALADPSAADVYRYSPWFAALWVPLTFIPKVLVGVVWSAVLVAATAVALWPLRRGGLSAIATAFLLGSFLIWGASVGNVQPLLIAALVQGLERRSGPLWIGIAASLKAVPILYVLLYVGRREWARAGAALVITGLLVAPFLLFDLGNYPAGSGDAPSPLLAISPVLYAAGLATLAVTTIWLAARRAPYDRLAAATSVLAALPRITLLDLPHLLVGVRPERPER